MLEVGQPAPPFSLESDSGDTISLDDLRGRPVVVYFYPKDDTPGCTRQACSIRDSWAEFGKIGASVIGVSPQSADVGGRTGPRVAANDPAARGRSSRLAGGPVER